MIMTLIFVIDWLIVIKFVPRPVPVNPCTRMFFSQLYYPFSNTIPRHQPVENILGYRSSLGGTSNKGLNCVNGVCVEERTLTLRFRGNLQDQSPAEERQLRVSHMEGAYHQDPGMSSTTRYWYPSISLVSKERWPGGAYLTLTNHVESCKLVLTSFKLSIQLSYFIEIKSTSPVLRFLFESTKPPQGTHTCTLSSFLIIISQKNYSFT